MLRILPLIAVFGCATFDGVERDWDDYVAEHNACELPEDCAVVYPGCPMGCFTAVNAEHATEAQAYAQELSARLQRSGSACDYDCLPHGAPRCESGRCVVEADEDF